MATPLRSKPARGLQDIRTMSELITETSNPQRKYLKLAMLTMEKVRRGKERKSACQRIKNIDSRLVEIEAECTDLLQSVSTRTNREPGDSQTSQPKQAPRPNTRAFRVRY